MFSWIRRRCSYANVVATLALFFAMTGGALAASHYLITSTKQIKPSVLSALKGKAGVAGANGAAGATGPAGIAGAAGAKGETGASGSQGPQGEPGKNGKNGTNGTTGFTEVLPPEKTETGAWSVGQVLVSDPEPGEPYFETAPISFSIPLKEALPTGRTHYISRETVDYKEVPAECPGSVEKPVAEPGNLCVYEGSTAGFAEDIGSPGSEITIEPGYTFNPAYPPAVIGEFPNTAGTTGAVLWLALPKKNFLATSGSFAEGTWAVTAPAES
jgi:hypothetical protein